MTTTLNLFGPIQFTRHGSPITRFESDKVRALLVYLAVEADRPHRRSALAELLWPERPERKAQLNLNQALANLRQAIGDREATMPLLLSSRETIQLNPAADCAVDIGRFFQLVQQTETHTHRDLARCRPCAERLEQAVALYRGPFLDQFMLRDNVAFQEWALITRERAQRQVLEALEQLVTYHERRGEHAALLQAAYRQLEIDPWREETHRLIMRQLWREGQRTAALAQYERCRVMLETELGLEPDNETTALFDQIARSPGNVPSAVSTTSQTTMPAAQVTGDSYGTQFLGRETELGKLIDDLGNPACRLVTITGLGGSGKTRLAMQAASVLRHSFADGVSIVPLAAVQTAEAVVPAIAQKLELTLHQGDAVEQLGALLDRKHILLVLDNLEQIAGVGGIVAGLLANAPQLTVLATSRERLGLRGEWVLDLHGLEIPEHASEAALESASASALFLQSARRARATFAPDEVERRAIQRICQQLHGHPLGIELASAWVHVLSCAEIEAELAANSELLASDAPDLPERHRTIRAVFDSSWRLLAEEDRAILRRLAVFSGGFERAAAAQVAQATLPRLAALINRSLLMPSQGSRYTMHELARQYALEQLQAAGESEATAEKHGAYFAQLVQQAEPHMKSAEEAAWLDRLEREHDNVQAALAFARSHDKGATAARMCATLRWFWYMRGYLDEGSKQTRAVLHGISTHAFDVEPLISARLFQAAGIFADEQGDYANAANYYAQAITLYRDQNDRKGEQAVSNSLGVLALSQGDYNKAQACYEASLAICRQIEHPWGIANSLNNLGSVLYAQGETAQALAHFEHALEYAHTAAYEPLITMLLDNLGEAALAQQETERARASFLQALARQHASSDTRGAALSEQGLGLAALVQGDRAQAAQFFVQSLARSRSTASRRELTLYVDNCAALLVAQNRFEQAVRCCAATHTVRAKIGILLAVPQQTTFEHTVEHGRRHLGTTAFDQAWAAGCAMSLDQAIDEVLAALG